MTDPTRVRARSVKTLAIAGFGAFGAAASLGFGTAVATAEVEEWAPGPTVTSRQASENSVVRINDFGVARGVSEARLGDAGVVSAQGEVRDSTKAVVGGTASGFEGSYPTGPAIGDW